MALGPGKYDRLCTQAREGAKAESAILIILGGEFGNGFSVQGSIELTAHIVGGEFGNGFSVQGSIELTAQLPQILRNLATDIEGSFPKR